MKDFDRLRIRFRQFGGWRLAWEYARLGLTWTIVKEILHCAIHGKSFKGVYPAIGKVVDPMLIKRYHHITDKYKDMSFDCKDKPNVNSNDKTYVWSCWLQGWDNAPELAKACLASLKRNLTNVEIVEIDLENYTQWVTLPEYIAEKYRKGYIPHAMFSDMLRLHLLAEHGGVWIDSTVLASPLPTPTGKRVRKSPYSPSWKEIIEADLFVFQYTRPGYRFSGNISNWFIASKKGNPFIMTLRDMLFAYWKDYDVALEYYICHLFFIEVAKVYPKQINNMPYGWSTPSITLGGHLGARYREDKWQQLISQVHWHKMTYRKEKELRKNKDNYYSHIIRELRTL